ncbi:MAG: arginine repressor [Eubacteriales bacterium]|nr:arginine repressor [Eubacteriales bacterium]
MKSTRQNAILDVIREKDVETQEQLADELRALGFKATQATVSRDIKELRLTKALSPTGAYKYATSDRVENAMNDRLIRMLSDSLVSMTHAYNQIVVKTLSGSANVAAEAIDNLAWPEILGTLAGDNTILMIVRSVEEVQVVIDRINEMIRR